MTIIVGEVVAINGVKITLHIFEEANKEFIFYNGDTYKGVSIREHIAIKRGFKEIICIIEGEYLDEKKIQTNGDTIEYIRKVEVKPIGYFFENKFYEGIKFLPMIKDSAILLSEREISHIYNKHENKKDKESFIIGKMLKEEITVHLPWEKIFNTHIGIFGNTGSGKSNTLTKIYTALFQEKLDAFKTKSQFVIIDFNGEYMGDQLTDDKKVLNLSTKNYDNNKFPLNDNEFWDSETLSILFKATENTQKPFLKRIIKGRETFKDNSESLRSYFKSILKKIFTCVCPKKETLDLMRTLSEELNLKNLQDKLDKIVWHSSQSKFFCNGQVNTYFDTEENYTQHFPREITDIQINLQSQFQELKIRINLQLINDLIKGSVQFDHIQPLLRRVEASCHELEKVISVVDDNNKKIDDNKVLTVISLRECNQDIKKILPLLIVKNYYHNHKNNITNPPKKTLHLIIDEAHNILSETSTREQESWRDYRLEMFEEIIKEGRKFGVFLTIASQRPADISPTIVSQLHNFFIHRLVNDRDLFLLNNTISTLDNLSKGLIPNLAKGCCVITGTSFDIPMIIQVDKLEDHQRPNSDDVDLAELWK